MGDQVEVNAQLIDAESGTHVWADRFETDRRNLAEAQSEITGRLAHTLDLQLVEAAGRRIELEKGTDPDASDLAMRGWVLWFRPFSAGHAAGGGACVSSGRWRSTRNPSMRRLASQRSWYRTSASD